MFFHKSPTPNVIPSMKTIYTQIVLTVIAIFLGILACRPSTPVLADSQSLNLWVEPGTTNIRDVKGGTLGDGKIMINMNTGDVWGFPMKIAGVPYPTEALTGPKPVTIPAHLGKFDLDVIRRSRY